MEKEKIVIDGWKGKGEINIKELLNSYEVIEYSKEKESREVKKHSTIIPKLNVHLLWKALQKNCEKGKKYTYRYLVKLVISIHNLHFREDINKETLVEAFFGMRKLYFSYYYYPMKVLEAKGKIRYPGKGGVVRLE